MSAAGTGDADTTVKEALKLSKVETALRLFNPRHNATRGKIAEIMVAQLTGGETVSEYEEYDVLIDGVIKVQVKATGLLQSWAKPGDRPSRPSFNGLKSRKLLDSGPYAEAATFNADVFVFCVHMNEDHAAPDTELDPDLWNFYVVPLEKIQAAGVNSMKLSTVEGLAVKSTPRELGAQVRAAYRAGSA